MSAHHKAKAMKAGGKVAKVLDEFKHGTLRSSSGVPVRDRQQALAIGISEQKRQQAGYADGGVVAKTIDKVSGAIERVGRAAGTERGRALEDADKAVKKTSDDRSPLKRGEQVDRDVEKAERGYANGGLVSGNDKGLSPAAKARFNAHCHGRPA